MPALETRREFAIVVQDRDVARELPRSACIRRFTRASEALFEKYRDIFVSVPLLELPGISDFIREANNRHYLRRLFVRDKYGSNLLPQFLAKANLRTLRNLMIHSDATLPGRVLNAYCIGAEDDLIAHAQLLDDHLLVVNCTGKVLDLPVKNVPVLKELNPRELIQFKIPQDGSYICWPSADIHLDLEIIRSLLDPEFSRQKKIERCQNDALLGEAVSVLRRSRKLRQTDIAGLSARQVRRIENGQQPRTASLQLLAKAHNMPVHQYLDRIAEITADLQKK